MYLLEGRFMFRALEYQGNTVVLLILIRFVVSMHSQGV
jgi:hypothetical protein